MEERKRIALVAHDNCKLSLLKWVEWNWELLIEYKLICTGTTGNLVESTLQNCMQRHGKRNLLSLAKLKSGPLGGDQQLGAMICNGEVDILIFFWDAMEPQPHDVDIKALLRIATLYNIVYACSQSTADFVISSPLLKAKYEPAANELINDYSIRKLK